MARLRWIPSIVAAAMVAPALGMLAVQPASAATMPDPGVKACDALVTTPTGHSCLLPWPNDAFTKKAATPTGRLVNLSPTSTPANNHGVHMNPKFQNRNDGFSPGSVVLIQIPNLSIENSDIAPSTDIAKSGCSIAGVRTDPSAPIVLWDTKAKKCVPYFAEIDAQNPDPTQALLMIHPVVNYKEGHRIDVVLRDLHDNADVLIPQLAGETAALHGTMTPKSRGSHLKWLTTNDLKTFDLEHLYAAWDFTVITAGGTSSTKFSSYNLADPALTMRNQAYKLVGTTAPVFRVDAVTDSATVHQVTGAYQVPTFLQHCPATQTASYNSTNTAGCGGMSYDKNGLPKVLASHRSAGTWTNQIWANFICVMPLTMSATPAQPTVYGHGLLGSADEVAGSSFKEDVNQNMMGCATDWAGMSENDLLYVAAALHDMSYFHVNVEHMLQGMLDQQFLGRLINSPKGFATNAAFQQGGVPRFAVGSCQYMGYSQGGIMGGATSAISKEWKRAVLGVPGQNYGGLLLNRSVDWDEFAGQYRPAYPDYTDQQVGLQMAQMLWDRGENDGYSEHITTHPYAGTKAKQVFITENYGDHQVSMTSAESLARTIGALAHAPAFDSNAFGSPRTNLPVTIQWGIPAAVSYAAPMKAFIELWDFGSVTPPTVDLAPGGPAYGPDPHGWGRKDPNHVNQIRTFMTTGLIPDFCGAVACSMPPG